ncbi:MAG: hypothetical protein SGPRY_008812, partial [Prymnesium sp.]
SLAVRFRTVVPARSGQLDMRGIDSYAQLFDAVAELAEEVCRLHLLIRPPLGPQPPPPST